MSEAEKLFSQTLYVTTTRFSLLINFRQMARTCLHEGAATIYQERFDLARKLFSDPRFDKFFLDKQAALEAIGGINALGRQVAEDNLTAFQEIVDSASLVFAHSILDGVALDYCRATALASPSDWARFVDKKKITLLELKDQTYDQMLQQKVTECAESLDKESLLKKVDRLFEVCRPQEGFNFDFDRGRLSALDEMRHEIVHGSGPVSLLPKGDDDILFLNRIAFLLAALVNIRYGFIFDTNEFYAFMKQQSEKTKGANIQNPTDT